MPLEGKNVGDDIREFHKGKTYKKTKGKFGKKRADKQAVAVAKEEERRQKKGKRGSKRR